MHRDQRINLPRPTHPPPRPLPTIDEAKARLMRLNGWPEPVARNAMIRASQDHRMPLAMVARLIVGLVV